MRRFFAGLMLAVLVGCTPDTGVESTFESLRDPSAQIASQIDVTAQRMAGDWVIRQSFAGQPGPSNALSLAVLPNGALQLSVITAVCNFDSCAPVESLAMLAATGPGRWTPTADQAVLSKTELWVMWMDFDSRTAAIGTPSGEFGWIMDKNPTVGRDRITAARDIMDWFGYDVSKLEEVEQ
jgi:apolipoprotein D and lipocalin family protein